MSDFPFPGLNLALATPFTGTGAIDYRCLEQNVEKYLAAEITGFVISSGTGMHVYLSSDESEELVARSAKIINGRARIIVQTSALLTQEILDRTRHAEDCGAHGIMVLPPYFEGPTDDDEIVAFYATVASAGLPVIGYNVPHAVGLAITPALLNKLSTVPGFCTIKDSSGDFAKQGDLIRTGHPVMNGADPLTLYALYAGCSGLIWGGANFAPKTCVAMVNAATSGKWREARAIWAALEPAMSLIWEGDYVKRVYAAADYMGYGAGVPRRPLTALSSDKLERLHLALKPLQEREGMRA